MCQWCKALLRLEACHIFKELHKDLAALRHRPPGNNHQRAQAVRLLLQMRHPHLLQWKALPYPVRITSIRWDIITSRCKWIGIMTGLTTGSQNLTITLLTTSTTPAIFTTLESYIRRLKRAANALVGLIQKA